MKTAKQIKVDNRTTTIITCNNCGKQTQVKASGCKGTLLDIFP